MAAAAQRVGTGKIQGYVFTRPGAAIDIAKNRFDHLPGHQTNFGRVKRNPHILANPERVCRGIGNGTFFAQPQILLPCPQGRAGSAGRTHPGFGRVAYRRPTRILPMSWARATTRRKWAKSRGVWPTHPLPLPRRPPGWHPRFADLPNWRGMMAGGSKSAARGCRMAAAFGCFPTRPSGGKWKEGYARSSILTAWAT